MVPIDACDADVEFTGAATSSWVGNGSRTDVDGAKRYQSSNGKGDWVFLTVENGKRASLVITVREKDYSANRKTVKVERGDGGVEFSAVVEMNGDDAAVEASFTCDQG